MTGQRALSISSVHRQAALAVPSRITALALVVLSKTLSSAERIHSLMLHLPNRETLLLLAASMAWTEHSTLRTRSPTVQLATIAIWLRSASVLLLMRLHVSIQR